MVAVLVFALALPLKLSKSLLQLTALGMNSVQEAGESSSRYFQCYITLIFLDSRLLPAFSTRLQCGELLAHLLMFISPLS